MFRKDVVKLADGTKERMVYLPCMSRLYSSFLHNNNMPWSVPADIRITRDANLEHYVECFERELKYCKTRRVFF